ncbi:MULTISPECIES: glycoside hydrolase family 73 protein [Enterococcus]|uniref:N-acetylmuramoyl-L-alanine amidase n=1 Tax=Enterococcus thailandicus TaxID=417368 RepID=A0A179EW32_ENTTH|nr:MULTISPECIES: glycoside hydrolase family 73 protein [Enterococcus]ASZ07841.1 N-acetylmuramoyl-L-alanine amidase [Enterococcus thailandicus]MDA3973591.1 glycoside hydrolase family 73 protein [Enterococcus thailandicus]MDA3975824.1 glycoside hydrolase family 73 protein [Enterococcus thailandicus]MDA3981050.1 glycoside hydrolase family 73 protein [Enterococcus thailandicus]MDT2846126.1 glycoside hydrolase family 73 protein [Enterococcus thailandicus]
MAIKKFKSRRRKKMRFIVLCAGSLLILFAFFASLRGLMTPLTDHSAEQEAQSHQEFIQQLVPHAQELQNAYGILPSIILGQAILESNWGKSTLASEYKNLFGIKAYGDQEKVSLETKEYVNEAWITIQGEFRVYHSWEESMDDHTQLFIQGVDWNPALYERVITASNYQEASQALQDAGYATDPTYAQKIIQVIETYHLDQYDRR